LAYESHILDHAQRDIKKLPTRPLQENVLEICAVKLDENPLPDKSRPVVGHKNLFRVYSDDREYRIIYGVYEHLEAVIIVSVRKRTEDTYKHLPLKSLTAKLKELGTQGKAP
jgi:mRNA-degrading endonuclease RelE of RelBE toxin-antitoxin system